MTVSRNRQGFYDLPFTKVVNGDTTYFTTHVFCFQGTDILGDPQEISVIAGWIDSGAVQDVRVYDITNNLVIAEKIGITDEFPTAVGLGTLSNLPASAALWEIQMLSQNLQGPDGEVAAASAHMRF